MFLCVPQGNNLDFSGKSLSIGINALIGWLTEFTMDVS